MPKITYVGPRPKSFMKRLDMAADGIEAAARHTRGMLEEARDDTTWGSWSGIEAVITTNHLIHQARAAMADMLDARRTYIDALWWADEHLQFMLDNATGELLDLAQGCEAALATAHGRRPVGSSG